MSLAARADEPGAREDLEVMRRVGDALADLLAELLDRALSLGEHVNDLGAAPVAERLRDGGERVEESRLRSLSPHILKLSLEYLRSKR